MRLNRRVQTIMCDVSARQWVLKTYALAPTLSTAARLRVMLSSMAEP